MNANDTNIEGNILKIFSAAESKEIEKVWMATFCKNKQGFNTKAYKWHIFSGDGYPSVEGTEAQVLYDAHECTRYIIMSNEDEPAILTDTKPTDLNYSDSYVFPENMSWTMAFTHEEGWLGPYFAKHSNYLALEAANDKLKEKRKQIETAKQNGWM